MPPRKRKGWRGPQEPGEFPTLGYQVGEWMQEHLIIPDGPQRGAPYLLTDEMWMHLIWLYRLYPNATVHPRFPRVTEGRVYRGSQLRRPQKWGKDPFMAAGIAAHCFGPVQFDGWDAAGEPVGRQVDTPWVHIAANDDVQTGNTYKPLFRMLTEGPLGDTSGMDVGVTSTKLPNGDGWIEPVTCSATSRLGAPITHATFTEPHLMTKSNGGLDMIRAMKRGLTGMGGDWREGTNAWDPTENSAAQYTAEDKAADVYLDHRATHLPNLTREEFDDDAVVLERIVIKYGNSCRAGGGWVVERDILSDVRKAATGESEARRYFLDEEWVGESDAVNASRWNALARPGESLAAGEAITLGFDGSRLRDCTALKACRIRDGRWFTVRIWDPAKFGGRIPASDVDQVVEDTMNAYQVWFMLADPFKWETSIDRWAGKYGDNPAGKPTVIVFPTTNERRMDDAIIRWQTSFRRGEAEFTHDGDELATKHAFAAAIALGKKKPKRDDGGLDDDLVGDDPAADGGRTPDRYQRLTKKKGGVHIDDFVAGVLATEARGLAIKHGALEHNGRSAYEDSGLTVV